MNGLALAMASACVVIGRQSRLDWPDGQKDLTVWSFVILGTAALTPTSTSSLLDFASPNMLALIPVVALIRVWCLAGAACSGRDHDLVTEETAKRRLNCCCYSAIWSRFGGSRSDQLVVCQPSVARMPLLCHSDVIRGLLSPRPFAIFERLIFFAICLQEPFAGSMHSF